MLFNVVLGKLNRKAGTDDDKERYEGLAWDIKETERGNIYINNDITYQRINIGKYVEGEIRLSYMDYVKAESGDDIGISYFNFPKRTRFLRYPNNFNLILLNTPRNDKTNYNENHLMYVNVVDTDYRLISYDLISNDEIIETYKVKDVLRGCLVSFSMIKDDENLYDQKCVLSLIVQDLKTNKFKRFEINCNRPNENSSDADISIDVFDITSKGDIKYIKKILKNKYPTIFKNSPSMGLITQGYVVTNDKYKEEIEEKLSDSDIEPVIIVTNQKKLDRESDQYSEDEVKRVADLLKTKSIRVATAYKCHMPKNFCKDFNIKYLYSYDDKTDQSKCTKSN